MKSLVLFNNKGGVGKTTLGFNIAHRMAREGLRVVAIDFDPQCNLTAMFLEEDALIELWDPSADSPATDGRTVADCIDLVRRGKGEVRQPKLIETDAGIWLLPGHLALSRYEQTLAEEWPKITAQDNERALAVTQSLGVLSAAAAQQAQAEVVLFDVGPSLGALNRAVLLACDYVLVPVAPDLFSLQGLRNVGPTLREWRQDYARVSGAEGSQHRFEPLGYILQQHLARADRPVAAYAQWAGQIPAEFHRHVLGEDNYPGTTEEDPYCLAALKHYASLVPLAQQARKAVFDLKPAHGIGGGQIQAVARCRKDFSDLVARIRAKMGV